MMVPSLSDKPVAIIGGGPAGLMAAEILVQCGAPVHVYDAMPSVGRKFLLAGIGGLNITHAEPTEAFMQRYGERRSVIEPYLREFGAHELREWIHGLGISTFVGTSGRVFPDAMKAAPLLRAWIQRLREAGVEFHARHRWQGWASSGQLRFATEKGEKEIASRATVLALGGASWKKLGSDGSWVPLLQQQHIQINELQPANCGFNVAWSEHLRERHAGAPLKPVCISFRDRMGIQHQKQGECIVTRNGLEGSLIYAFSAMLRDLITHQGEARITMDLCPDRELHALIKALSQARGSKSFSHHLQQKTGIAGVKAGLLYEMLDKQQLQNAELVAQTIKALPITLISTRPLDEAISSAGGIAFAELDTDLMLKQMPGVFCAGEMLDWEAPTGGYLLTACFSTGRHAGMGALKWLKARQD